MTPGLSEFQHSLLRPYKNIAEATANSPSNNARLAANMMLYVFAGTPEFKLSTRLCADL